jgi:hypothetical protein
MSYGFKTFKANGEIEWSFTGLSPRLHSKGLFTVPAANGLHLFTVSVPEITDPSEWAVVEVNVFQNYTNYTYFYSFSISIGQVDFYIPGSSAGVLYCKYLLFKIK